MQQGICNKEFYGYLVCKFKKIIENPGAYVVLLYVFTPRGSHVEGFPALKISPQFNHLSLP